MNGELLAISGPLLCERFPLGEGDTSIGRSPQSMIVVDEPGIAWEHCVVRPAADRYRLRDCRTGLGTFVNGKRITEHALEPGDQVSIGESVFLYREEANAAAKGPPQILLRTCALQFLFRALAKAESPSVRALVESQIMRLIGELAPASGGAILLGKDAAELRAAASLRSGSVLSGLAERVCSEGNSASTPGGDLAVPLYVRGAIAGIIAAHFPPAESARLGEHADTLAAIASLGAMALETVEEVQQLRTEKALLTEQLDGYRSFPGIVGSSPALQKLMQRVTRVAGTDASVLLLGESGTGKERVAQAIHQSSIRSRRAFVPINCAALTETLLESELFGHEKGSFTGATTQKKGKLEMAEGGTVFLDEIGELAAPLQAKLLRVLQERELQRVGGTQTLKLDVRLIAATNRDLASEVRRGAFREDLYHRLNVVALNLPPLRERVEDIPALAEHFLQRAAARCCRRMSGVSPEALEHLKAYSWPGNVRELENAIERAVVLGQSEFVLPEDLPETVVDAPSSQAPGALLASVADTKRQLILRAWEESGGDYKLAALKLNIHPNSLIRLIRTLGLRESLK